MEMTEKLKTMYSSNIVEQLAYDTVEVYHPNFTETFYLVADYKPHTFKLEDGTYRDFQPFGFTITRPDVGSNQQDMQFNFSNVGQVGITQMELAAEDTSVSVTLKFRVYIDGDVEPQTAVLELQLTNITATSMSISGTISSSIGAISASPIGISTDSSPESV